MITDEIVEKAWAAIVGSDVAPICFQASIIRADLKVALTAALGDAVVVPAGLKPADVQSANYRMGRWLSAALEDPIVCAAMKSDINDWFEANPTLALPRHNRDGVAE